MPFFEDNPPFLPLLDRLATDNVPTNGERMRATYEQYLEMAHAASA
jgi:hypothetical protein